MIRSVTNRSDQFEILAEDFELQTIVEQNDIDPVEVLKLMYLHKMFDLDDYFYIDGTLIDPEL